VLGGGLSATSLYFCKNKEYIMVKNIITLMIFLQFIIPSIKIYSQLEIGVFYFKYNRNFDQDKKFGGFYITFSYALKTFEDWNNVDKKVSQSSMLLYEWGRGKLPDSTKQDLYSLILAIPWIFSYDIYLIRSGPINPFVGVGLEGIQLNNSTNHYVFLKFNGGFEFNIFSSRSSIFYTRLYGGTKTDIGASWASIMGVNETNRYDGYFYGISFGFYNKK